jgi:hypothetical protein
VPRDRELEMVGRAVFVTEPSSAESRRGMQRAIKERQKPSPRVHFSDGVSDGMLGGIGGRVGFSSWAAEWWRAEESWAGFAGEERVRARKRTPVLVEEGSFSPNGEVEYKAEGASSSVSSAVGSSYSSGGVGMLIVGVGRSLDDLEGNRVEDVESRDC